GFVENGREQCIASAIVLLDARREFWAHIALVTRMIAITEAPYHVLYPIGSVVEHEEKTFIKSVKLKTHQPLTLCEHQLAVLQVRGLIQPAIVEAVVILRHSERREQSDLLRQFFCIVSRIANWKHGRVGI